MTDDPEALRRELEQLRIDHRDLDEVIAQLTRQPWFDMLQVQRLKRRKLALKDRMAQIESLLIPDIIA